MQVIPRPIRIYHQSSRPKGSLQCREFFEGEESESIISFQRRQLNQCFVEFLRRLRLRYCKLREAVLGHVTWRDAAHSWHRHWQGHFPRCPSDLGRTECNWQMQTWFGHFSTKGAMSLWHVPWIGAGGHPCKLQLFGRGMLSPVHVAASASAAVPPCPMSPHANPKGVNPCGRHISLLFPDVPISPCCLNVSKWPHSMCVTGHGTEKRCIGRIGQASSQSVRTSPAGKKVWPLE